MKRLIIAVYYMAFVLFSGLSYAADDVAKANAILVLDASGSMWGEVEGKPKIVIAREVIADMMKDWDEEVYLGLSAYGHNKKGDCSDIEMLVPVGANTGNKIIETVNKINPKGKTPLSAAVKKAAEELKYTEQAATVILLSDGIETCDLDPCAIGKSLEENGIDFTAHVIGFNVKVEDQAGLKCLAENTGGKFLSAENAVTLGDALQQVAEEVRSGADRVYVIVDKSGERYQKDVRWDIFAVDENDKEKGKPLFSHIDDFVRLKEPGRYMVHARVGQAVYASKLIEVKADETQEHEIDMRGGTFKLSGLFADGITITKGDIYWYIYPYNTDGTVNNKSVYSNVGRNIVAELPPGKFRIHTKYFGAYKYVDIVSKAGETVELPVNFNAGNVKFIPQVNGNPPNSDIYYYIYNLDENGKTIGTQDSNVGRHSEFWFTLNAGTYRLEARHSGFDNQFIDFEIKPGETTEQIVSFTSSG